MNELLKEIEQDLRREQAERLWRKFGVALVAAAGAVILVTIVTVTLDNYRRGKAEEQTAQFIKGVEYAQAKNYKEAIAAFDVLAKGSDPSYYGLAMLRKAQAQTASGDKDGAAETYRQLAQYNKTFGSLGQMLAPDGKATPPAKESVFYYTQSEWNGWQLLQQGKKDEATAQFVALRDAPETPYTLRERMYIVLQHLTSEKPQAAKVSTDE